MYRHSKDVVVAGSPAAAATSAIIMLHGRGSSAEDIVSLQKHLPLEETAIFAPQAAMHSWYPYSFMAPAEKNQPALDSALEVIRSVVSGVMAHGFTAPEILFLGFSQGACLGLEYTARHPQRYKGIIAFTGGLIGESLNEANYQGDFGGTPLLLTTGNPDAHVPLTRVEESAAIFTKLNASVQLKVYNGRPHTIGADEIRLASHVIRT